MTRRSAGSSVRGSSTATPTCTRGRGSWAGRDVKVTLQSDDKRDLTPTLEHAGALYARFPAVMERVRDYAADWTPSPRGR